MAIIVPTAYSTYGDATSAEGGGPLRQYILAQLRSDSNLSWVGRARAALIVDELKWKVLEAKRPILKQSPDLWSEIVEGVKQATVVVIDPRPVAKAVEQRLLGDGAEAGHDFDDDDIIKGCASAIVDDTPVAYLPNELARMHGCYPQKLLASFDDFTPLAIQKKIGPGLRDAKVFAARAHATFDIPSNCAPSTRDVFRSPAAPLVVAELLSVTRVFDEEHPESVAFLNEATDVIAKSLEQRLPTFGARLSDPVAEIANNFGQSLPTYRTILPGPLVQEYSSDAIDHVQAADVAAGWARELLELGDMRALARTFSRVLLNGVLMKE
jgi:hypothetical protein